VGASAQLKYHYLYRLFTLFDEALTRLTWQASIPRLITYPTRVMSIKTSSLDADWHAKVGVNVKALPL
jgi:hypothetical protein